MIDLTGIRNSDLRETLEYLFSTETEEKILSILNTGLKTIEYRNRYSKSEKAKEYRREYGQKQRDLFKRLKRAEAEGRLK